LNTEEVTNKDEINVDGTIKDTNIEIVKTLEKNNPKDTDKNTYTVDIRNKGEYVARGVTVEEKIDKNGEILKDTVKVLNSKGEDVTKKITDLKIEKDMITFTIDNIGKNENYKLVYDVKYNEIEKTEEMVSVTKVKAKNSKEEIIVTKNKIDVTVKETKLEIEKTVEKKEVRAGEKNTYIITLKNIGKYDAKDVIIEDKLIGNAKYIENSVKIENNDNLEIEQLGNGRFKIKVLPKEKSIIIRYEVEYLKQEEDSIVTNKVESKGSNTDKVYPKEKEGVKVKVVGVKDLIQKILPKAGERSKLIYIILAIIILMPSIILRREYIQAKKRQNMRRNRKR
jgi:conserved repeat protein